MFRLGLSDLRTAAFVLGAGLAGLGGSEALALNSDPWIIRPPPGQVQQPADMRREPYRDRHHRGYDRDFDRDDRWHRPRHDKFYSPYYYAPRQYYRYYQPPIFEWWWKWYHVPRHLEHRLPLARSGCEWRVYGRDAYLVERGTNIVISVVTNFY